jgi:Holliday junction resolvase-like predicted endonuclease
MEYNKFKTILNEVVFEKSKADLLCKVADYPVRYIGIFRPTKPKAKILQNLLQSHEIRFGDAFEQIIEAYLKIKGCEMLPKKYTLADGNVLNIDQCFKFKNKVYFVEQKIRDDHDSTKKRGQIQNFEKKLDLMLSKHKETDLVGIVYFIDSDFGGKNKKYYTEELEKMTIDYNIETQIFYGKSLFDYLNMADVWEEILVYLREWKLEIPDLPEINFDIDAEDTFNEIKDLKPAIFRKLLDNDEIYEQIIKTLFPENKTLKLLLKHFETQEATIYQTLADKLRLKIH